MMVKNSTVCTDSHVDFVCGLDHNGEFGKLRNVSSAGREKYKLSSRFALSRTN